MNCQIMFSGKNKKYQFADCLICPESLKIISYAVWLHNLEVVSVEIV